MSTKQRVKAAVLFHALSDRTRLEILARLKEGEQCVCELTDALQTGQSRLSFHLKVLKEAGFIRDRPEGRWMYYSLNREGVEDLEDFVDELKNAIAIPGSSKKKCE
ncbi:MAG: winged helix-turn-helix transcriptional regulator [Nitrospira sp.]|nr:winged helix-turn-helix transcriptional regulator [Nitrospira sp.]